jgi:hypothetical protein
VAPIDDDLATRPRGSWPGHYPSTLYVRRSDGASWIARVFSSAADRLDRVQGDAEILRFLAQKGFPAERLAVDDPVSIVETSAVVITQVVAGGRPTDADGRSNDPAVLAELGGLLGRLHALPASGGAVARDGGAEEADGGFYVGRPGRDLEAAMGFLAAAEAAIPEAGREKFDWLRAQVETADDAEGLPEALTHGNFHLWSAVGVPGGLTIVGWAGSGRGPRLPALAWLLRTAAEGGPHLVDAVVRGYSEHVQLTEDELDRLPGILNLRPLWLACLDLRMTVEAGDAPALEGGWMDPRSAENAERLAAQVVRVLRR